MYYAYPRAPKNGYGDVSLILGVPALLVAWIPVLGIIAWPFAIAGTWCGALGVKRLATREADNSGVTWGGFVTSLLALGVCVLYLVITIITASLA